MDTILEYKCPNCGGALRFDSASQSLKCVSCSSQFTPEALKEMDDVLNADNLKDDFTFEKQAGSGDWKTGETDNMHVYVCKSCGGEIVADDTTGATSCPYCGNQVVIAGQFSGELRPDYVIPFKLDKKAATEALSNHLCKKRLLPKIFKEKNHIDEVKGVYVPFWLFDTDVSAQVHFDGKRVRTWSDTNYTYTEVKHYDIYRDGDIKFDRIPVDGSLKMADDLMESIEPFDFSSAVPFETAYLAGYLADKYDVDAEKSTERAVERIKNSAAGAFRGSVTGYSSVTPTASAVQIKDGKIHYALYPVWILNTTWNNEKFTFAMNGQTGKFVGDLPLDKKAYSRWLFGLTAGFSAVLFALSYLLGFYS